MKEINMEFEYYNPATASWEYTIPSGYEAEIKDGKVIVRKKEEPLTEFGDGVLKVIADYVHIPKDKDGALNIHDLHEFVENASKELLELAFKSPEFKLALQKKWDEGNLIGYGAGQKSVEKDLPKWKKAKKPWACAVGEFLFTLDKNGTMSPYWETEVEEGQYYITERDILKLPKEE